MDRVWTLKSDNSIPDILSDCIKHKTYLAIKVEIACIRICCFNNLLLCY